MLEKTLLDVAKQWGNPILFVSLGRQIIIAYLDEQLHIIQLPENLLSDIDSPNFPTEECWKTNKVGELYWDNRVSVELDKCVSFCRQQMIETPVELNITRYFWRRLLRIVREKFGNAKDKIENENENEVLLKLLKHVDINFMGDLILEGYIDKAKIIINLLGISSTDIEKKLIKKMLGINGDFVKSTLRKRLNNLEKIENPDIT